MLTEITVEDITIKGFKKYNMIVGHPDHIDTILREIDCSVNWVARDIYSYFHYTELENNFQLLVDAYGGTQSMFHTTQRMDVIGAYHKVVMCNPEYADDATFISIGRSKSGRLVEHFYNAGALQIYLENRMEIRG